MVFLYCLYLVVIQSCCWIGVLVYAYFCLNICHFIIAWLGLVPHTSRIESLQYTSHYYSTIQFFYRLLHHIGPSALLIDYFIAINKKKKVSRIITSLKIFFCWVISFYSSHINQVIAFFSDCLYISLTIFGIIRVLWISRVTAKSLSPTVTIILADLNRHEK
ncbi:hypothetical protein BC833DRAFT_98302 [Globomyces pollinis-pini]|nr:hypothetical protein BC833DRAFT_98302 [Globomyces pollinis-pini]